MKTKKVYSERYVNALKNKIENLQFFTPLFDKKPVEVKVIICHDKPESELKQFILNYKLIINLKNEYEFVRID